jgi:hypothetical protein
MTLPSVRLENRTFAQTFSANIITPVVFTTASNNTAFNEYYTFGSYPVTNLTILKQAVYIVTAGITMGTVTSGMYTVMIQYLPYKANAWITIAAHTVVGSVNDAGAIKVPSCQVVWRFQENDTVRVCALSPLNNVTIAVADNLATGSMFPYMTLTRALI